MTNVFVVSLLVGLAVGQIVEQPRDASRPSTRAGSAVIRGIVSGAETGLPVRRAVVTLLPMAPPRPPLPPGSGAAPLPRVEPGNPLSGPPRNVLTDANGRFEFTGLPAGSYRLRVQPAPHSGQYLGGVFGGKDLMDMGRPIDIKDGEQFDQANIALRRGGAIVGRVIDEDGEPVSRVNVYSARVMPGSGSIQRVGGGFIQSDDHGRYRIYGLEPGEYVVGAETRGYAGPQFDGVDQEGFLQTYHPSTPSDRDATRVRVRVAADTEGIDIQLVRTRTFRITGTVMDSQGQVVLRPNLQLSRQTASDFSSSGNYNMDPEGRFTIRDVAPGEYVLVVQSGRFEPPQPGAPPQKREIGMVSLSVAANIENVVVVTQPGVSVTGQVVFTDGQPAGDAGQVRVFTQPAMRRPMFFSQSNATVDANHRFTLTELFGPQLIRVGMRPDWAVKAIMLGATDITDTPVEFKKEHSGQLQILVSIRAAIIEGTITADDGAPVEQAMVLIFPEDKDSWRFGSPRVRITSSRPDGKYSTSGLVGGRYLAVAFPPRSFAFTPDTPPEVFEALARDATRLVVSDDERRIVDLRLSKKLE